MVQPAKRHWLFILLLFPVLTIFGNLLVVISVTRERNLRTATNYFIVSLAVADISLAIMVMPLSVWVEVSAGYWEYSEQLCDIFIMLDVMFSTASIMNLGAISIDRYFAVTQPFKYSRHNNFRRVYITICLTWILSFFIALPIACGLNNTIQRNDHECRFNNSNFIILSSMGSFYIPSVVLLILYYQIFKVLQRRGKKSTDLSSVKQFYSESIANNIHTNSVDTINKTEGCNEKTKNTNEQDSTTEDNFFPNKNNSSEMKKLSSSHQSSTYTNISDVENSATFDSSYMAINPIVFLKVDKSLAENKKVKRLNIKPHFLCNEIDSDYDSSTALSENENFISKCVVYTNSDAIMNYSDTPLKSEDVEQSFDKLGIEKYRTYQKIRLELIKKGVPFENLHNIAMGKVKTHKPFYCKSLKNSKQKLFGGIIQNNYRKRISQSIRISSFKTFLRRKSSTKMSAKREKKAIKTLVIVLVVFLICWVPFFTLNITQAFCLKFDNYKRPTFICTLNTSDIGSVTVWLGYINSCLNPIIYTIFNIEFRRAFKKILHVK